jgi:hypothetical protein
MMRKRLLKHMIYIISLILFGVHQLLFLTLVFISEFQV